MHRSVYEYISKKMNDPIVEWRTCRISGNEFAIYKSDIDFYKRVSPKCKGKSYTIPFPEKNQKERARHKMAFVNNKTLYKSTCAMTGKPIITALNPERHGNVYSVTSWWSDKRDELSYGVDMDLSKDFFPQYQKIRLSTPKIALLNDNGISSENCEYCQDFAYGKNCYLTSIAWKLEDCYYSDMIEGGKNMFDCYFCWDGSHYYQCINCELSDQIFYCADSSNCHDCWFGYQLVGCRHCLFCTNLVNKGYHIFNKPVTKEIFEQKKKELQQKMYQNEASVRAGFDRFLSTQKRVACHQSNCSNCVGDHLMNCKNMVFGFNCAHANDCRYGYFAASPSNNNDFVLGGEMQWCYDTICADHAYQCLWSSYTRSSKYCLYSEMCHHCEHCFGCYGLKHKKYCILNKQYTKEEYEELVSKIIEHMMETGEWGHFMPMKYSFYAYNESMAGTYHHLSRKEIEKRGLRGLERKHDLNISPSMESVDTCVIDRDPMSIDEVSKKAFVCSATKRPFRVLPQELAFYQKHGLPLPNKHPDQRFVERIERTSALELFPRVCGESRENVMSVYSEESEIDVLSEGSYREMMFG